MLAHSFDGSGGPVEVAKGVEQAGHFLSESADFPASERTTPYRASPSVRSNSCLLDKACSCVP
jgi:hypothetical protein